MVVCVAPHIHTPWIYMRMNLCSMSERTARRDDKKCEKNSIENARKFSH